MTKKELDTCIEEELLNEVVFLHGHDKIYDIRNGFYQHKLWIEHCKRFKKQMKEHIYSVRSFDLSRLQYK